MYSNSFALNQTVGAAEKYQLILGRFLLTSSWAIQIDGKAYTVNELLKERKYAIDYYQREYKWQAKQVRELIDDLTGKFLEDYVPGHPRQAVKNYSHYFLGSMIINAGDNANLIVDGQQRLTTLTLFLIYLNNLQRERPDRVEITDLIFFRTCTASDHSTLPSMIASIA